MPPKTLYANILTVDNGIIVHQVNNKRVMGRGLALKIKERFPSHFSDYRRHPLTLGSNVITKEHDCLYIVGLVAQDGYGTDRRYTDYNHFKECLIKLEKLSRDTGLKVYLPYKIGCGLAGGDWIVITKLIDTHLSNYIIVNNGTPPSGIPFKNPTGKRI